MAEVDRLKRQLSASFKANGFNPNREALELCTELLENFDKPKRTKWMEKIVATLRKQQLSSCVISGDTLRDVIQQIANGGNNQAKECLFNVFDAFSLPKYYFDTECKKMLLSTDPPQIASTVNKATESFRNRFQLIAQRSNRNKALDPIRSRIHTIDSLLGTTRKMEDVVVVAMLTQQKDDCFHLEDMTGSIQVDFVDTNFRPGLFFQGGIYMFEGIVDSAIFLVSNAALVPLESADDSRTFFGTQNFFGGDDPVAFRMNKKLISAENQNENAFMVILSDVHLDDPKVLQALDDMFTGYCGADPQAFIICGNFCSRPRQADSTHVLHEGFRRLANMLNQEKLRNGFKDTHFIFVPGPDDPALNMFLPRPHLPTALFKLFDAMSNVHFTSNPVRIQYGSKEIVVTRDDLVEKMCKHAVNKVHQKEIPSYFAKTALSQVHLSPFPMHISPVLWDWDYTLSLHPLPDLLVVADKFSKFSEHHARTHVCNPGSFAKSSFGFLVYYLQKNEVDDSQIQLK